MTENSQEDDRHPVSFDEAIAMLPDGDHVHTFRGTGPVMIGTDWPRHILLETIQRHGAELSGPNATRVRHGLVLFDDKGPLFIETK